MRLDLRGSTWVEKATSCALSTFVLVKKAPCIAWIHRFTGVCDGEDHGLLAAGLRAGQNGAPPLKRLT